MESGRAPALGSGARVLSGLPRIAVDVRGLVGSPTGIGFYTLESLRALAARGTADYLGLSHAPTSHDAELREAGVELERGSAPLGVIWQQLGLARRIGSSDVDLLWSPLNTLPVRLAKPGVVTIHDLTVLLFPESHTRKVRWSILPFLKRTIARAERIVTDSKSTADDLAAHFPASRGRVEVVYPGVDQAFAPAEESTIAEIRAELGCPEGYVLSVGTLEPRKNYPALLDAWQSLDNRPPLLIAGGPGWGSAELLRRLERLGDEGVRYLGRVDRSKLIKLFQGATAFVYPSIYEGFGLPPLEAMACGVPTLSSNSSSLGEVTGDAAYSFSPDDTDALASGLRRVLDDRAFASELSARGRERARGFDWRRTAEGLEGVFLESLQ